METYCHNCDKFVAPLLKQRDVKIPYKDRWSYCIEYYVVCPECGEEMYFGSVNDVNVLLRERAVRAAQWVEEHSF